MWPDSDIVQVPQQVCNTPGRGEAAGVLQGSRAPGRPTCRRQAGQLCMPVKAVHQSSLHAVGMFKRAHVPCRLTAPQLQPRSTRKTSTLHESNRSRLV